MLGHRSGIDLGKAPVGSVRMETNMLVLHTIIIRARGLELGFWLGLGLGSESVLMSIRVTVILGLMIKLESGVGTIV